MKFDTIHETVLKDITDIITGVDVDRITKSMDFGGSTPSISRASSLSKATSGLTLVFPVLCDRSNSLSTATMVAKAVERKAVTLLQVAFSAFNITNVKDATQFIKNFHTNLKGSISVDDFIDAMDGYVNEHNLVPKENMVMYRTVMEDLRNINFTFNDDISDRSINEYSVIPQYNGKVVVTEAPKPSIPNKPDNFDSISQKAYDNDNTDYKNKYQQYRDDKDDVYKKQRDDTRDKQWGMDYGYNKARDDKNDAYKAKRDDIEDARNAKRDDVEARKNAYSNRKNNTDAEMNIIKNQILPTDVKKANEMVPTMMVVNIVTVDKETQVAIDHPIVVGVKAKLYTVDTEDVINKIITKRIDNNILLKFIKASTREISFVKDFIFAIDNAKLSAKSNSIKGSQTNRLLKVLERRALGGKIRKAFKMNNAYKAISTMVISKDVADQIFKQSNIDVMRPNVIHQIMEALNLMMFIVADDSSESISLIMDTGDDIYETISYTNLEREASDNSSKKIVNLMTKIAR